MPAYQLFSAASAGGFVDAAGWANFACLDMHSDEEEGKERYTAAVPVPASQLVQAERRVPTAVLAPVPTKPSGLQAARSTGGPSSLQGPRRSRTEFSSKQAATATVTTWDPFRGPAEGSVAAAAEAVPSTASTAAPRWAQQRSHIEASGVRASCCNDQGGRAAVSSSSPGKAATGREGQTSLAAERGGEGHMGFAGGPKPGFKGRGKGQGRGIGAWLLLAPEKEVEAEEEEEEEGEKVEQDAEVLDVRSWAVGFQRQGSDIERRPPAGPAAFALSEHGTYGAQGSLARLLRDAGQEEAPMAASAVDEPRASPEASINQVGTGRGERRNCASRRPAVPGAVAAGPSEELHPMRSFIPRNLLSARPPGKPQGTARPGSASGGLFLSGVDRQPRPGGVPSALRRG